VGYLVQDNVSADFVDSNKQIYLINKKNPGYATCYITVLCKLAIAYS